MRFDNQTRKAQVFNSGEGTTLNEVVFAPKSKTSGEGVGYLMGVANRNLEGGRSDLIILDAERPDAGPIATVKLPIRAVAADPRLVGARVAPPQPLHERTGFACPAHWPIVRAENHEPEMWGDSLRPGHR